MSWYRQIKTFYTISINMFFFLIWGIISSVFLLNKVDYRLYLISLAAAFLLQFIISKTEGKKLPKLAAALVGIFLTFIVSKGIYFIFNSIFIIVILYITNNIEGEDINYDAYKARAKSGLILILFLGSLLPLVDMNLSRSILKFYIMFLISNIVVMREARSYYYKIRNPRSFIANMFISLAILGLSVDTIFTGFLEAFKYIIKIAMNIVSLIIDFVGMLIAKPMLFGINKLRSLITNTLERLKVTEGSSMELNFVRNRIPWEESDSLAWLYTVTKIIGVILVLLVVFIIVIKIIKIQSSKDTSSEVLREKIKRQKIKKEGFFSRLIKNILKPSDVKGQILYIYKRFEERTFEKGIFKSHMTAKQLENVTKAYVENPEGLTSLTNVYNETKFSKHEMNDGNLEEIKEGFNKIKRQL